MKRLLLIIPILCTTYFCNAQMERLQHEFKNPPTSVKTGVYWYWMCGNISKEGVIRDLEAMKKVGINRAFIGNIYFDPYPGGKNVKLMSDEWWEITHAALKKASELGIEIGMFNSPGWTQAGGPWVKPNEAMRYLATSELRIKGPGKIIEELKQPGKDFQDVRTIAYPVTDQDQMIVENSNAYITITPAIKHSEYIFDQDLTTSVPLAQNQLVKINMKTKRKFTARSITIYPAHSNIDASFELQVKQGKSYRTIDKFNIDWHNLSLIVGFNPFAPIVMSFKETTSDSFRLLIKNRRNEGGLAEVELSSVPKIENYAAKTLAKMFQDPHPSWNYYLWRRQEEATNSDLYIDPAKVLDISKYVDPEGRLNWKAPAGNWVIMRTGMVPTGVTNNPGGPDGTGLEVDKMNQAHVFTHFDEFIGKILKRIPAADRTTFKVVVQDSYESGGQNFTDNFLTDFKNRYGYDALPYLPAYFGKVVGNKDKSDRFLWDIRRLVADKIAYEYVGGFRKIAHQNGLTTWLENYGHWGFPAEFLMYGGQSDEVGGEYWLPSPSPSWENDLGSIENRSASSSAHIYGKTLVTAESNTSGGPAFSRVPADTKQRMDKYFAEGINNTLLHVFIHQPDSNRFPGTNAWFGTEFNENNTWFTHMDLYTDYIKRCNYMLRQGLNIADVAYFIGEDVPKMTGIQDPILPKGYQFDYINAEVLIRDARVRNGMITLPHGTAYRVLVLPKVTTMRPELLAKIQELIVQGAVVVGPPPRRSPSLENQPLSDQKVKKMAAALWKGTGEGLDNSSVVGKGMVFNGVSLETVFSKIGLLADCNIFSNIPINYAHRSMDGAEIYFLTNQSATLQRTTVTFRTGGLQPELWNPIDGSVRRLSDFSSTAKKTTLPIELQAYESAFIVFRRKGKALPGIENFPQPEKSTLLKNAWDVEFKSPLTNPKAIRLDTLEDLSKSKNNAIRYFSGNIIYNGNFNNNQPSSAEHQLYLDLGEVHAMAKVWINDQYVGGVWTPPYRLNISSAIKIGQNNIRIDVVNTWVNRLIGDKIVPEADRETWSGINPYIPESPLQKSGLIGPVKLLEMTKTD